MLVAPTAPVQSTPAAPNETIYQVLGRVFPDPHGCVRGLPLMSPWAKGSVCAVEFVQWDEAISGIQFLQQRFPRYIELINLRDLMGEDFRSAGIPQEDLSRDKRDLYMIKVTDRESAIPEAKRKHFVYSLSIHGIERAGLEGGIRAAEDLVTWAACEESADAAPACAAEGPFPKRILEPTESGPTAGEVLRNGVVYFMLANPDGWHRGDVTSGWVAYQRFNGNGMDLNRDWPTVGYTEQQYTPWSEPENRGYGKFLEQVRDKTAEKRFTGGIDLHGMLTARSFSFTLLGAGQRDYRKNAITVETAITTFKDSETRLSWSPLIAPADSCPGPIEEPAFGGNLPMCSDQWGTVWDTIDYQITGGVGDWFDSPMGLDAVAIDNEMALSHLSNCGIGTCFEPGVEQLHIDGNKGLIYAQIASLLFEKPTKYTPGGVLGYVFDPSRVRNNGVGAAAVTTLPLPAQEAIQRLHPAGTDYFTFDVKGPADGVRNGGMSLELTFANARGISPAPALFDYIVDFCGPPDHPGDEDGVCREVAHYFNQSELYLQAGARIDLNEPKPGPYRLRISSRIDPALSDEIGNLFPTELLVSFSQAEAYPVPKQAPYDVSRMDFFRDLNKYAPADKQLTPLTVAQILADPAVLNRFDSIVVADDFMPGYAATGASKYTKAQLDAYAKAFRAFVERGGNLMLTDGALAALPPLDARFKPGDVSGGYFYAGWVDFDDGKGETYERHPLAKGVNMEGTAEGSASYGDQTFTHRHQTYEPVPTGFYVSAGGDCFSDRCDSPNWVVDEKVWKEAGGTVAGRTFARMHTEPEFEDGKAVPSVAGVSLGELALGKGKIRIAGALLPEPTEANYHPYGLASYSLTYTGYQLFENMSGYTNPARVAVGGTKVTRPAQNPPLPATGVAPLAGLAAALMVAAGLGAWLRRRAN
jgi:hypothetical protein